MNHVPNSIAAGARDPVARLVSAGAFAVALLALVFAMGASSPAEPLAHQGKGAAQQAALKKLAARIAQLQTHCPITNSIKFGSWCLEAGTHTIPAEDVGKNDYFYAAQACAREGGWLPSAAQLIGAAPKAALQSTIDDDPATSGTEESPEARRGIKDKREMTGDLFTVAAGPAAAGSEGVTAGSRGVGQVGEPDPVPAPADPSPGSLDYVTVYDNHNHGGFAGGEPVGQPESFRCAYATTFQGKPKASQGN
ncbi:MAG TPA: hypothetical protein VF085_07940 [Solirubrobacterales bacterium]